MDLKQCFSKFCT